jgi:hypothetical protein
MQVEDPVSSGGAEERQGVLTHTPQGGANEGNAADDALMVDQGFDMVLRTIPNTLIKVGFRSCLIIVLTLLPCCRMPQRVVPPERIGAWLVYWDLERGLSELKKHGRLFDTVSLFAYELDPEGRPTSAPNLEETIPSFIALAKKHGFSPWVTVVNDVRSDNEVRLKDTTLLHHLLADPATREAHAVLLAEKAVADGFAGLHLDYERLPQTDEPAYQAFVTQLSAELRSRGLDLDVVLEPKRGPLPAPGETKITVMAYNLFGPHSTPGPRATPAFVSELSPKARVDTNGAPTLAIAVAGFAWHPDGKVTSVGWSQAEELAKEASQRRSSVFTRVPNMRLDDGTEVWFENPESLLAKWQAAEKTGFRHLMIWRLGGNDERLFRFIHELRQQNYWGSHFEAS